MRKKISVFIPVYRGPDRLEELLENLVADRYKNREIFVAVSKPAEKTMEIVKKYEKRVRFVVNKKSRWGKVEALEKIIRLSKGDIFIFFDSDTVVKTRNLFEKVAKQIPGTDILDFKKVVVKDSLVSRLVFYDFLTSSLISWIHSKTLGRCIGISGAGFAIKRGTFELLGGFEKNLTEDVSIALKSFTHGKKYVYDPEIEVQTESPKSLREWTVQRKRWALATALWMKDNCRDIEGSVKRHPRLLLPALLFVLPLATLILTLFLINSTSLEKILVMLLILLSARFGAIMPFIYFPSLSIVLLKDLLLAVINYAISSAIFYYFARKIKYKFNPLEFIVYFYLYSPIFIFMVMASLVKVLTCRHKYRFEDWKV